MGQTLLSMPEVLRRIWCHNVKHQAEVWVRVRWTRDGTWVSRPRSMPHCHCMADSSDWKEQAQDPQSAIYDSPPFFKETVSSISVFFLPWGTEQHRAVRNAKEKGEFRETHRRRIRYVMLHYTLVLYVVDHATLIGAYDEIS